MRVWGSSLCLVVLCACAAPPDEVTAPTSILYDGGPFSTPVGVALPVLVPTVRGGTPDSFTIVPALPEGLVLDAETGAISGTAVEVSLASSYEVSAANGAGTTSTTVNLAVTSTPPIPIGDVTVTDAGETVTVVTTGFADTIVGPILMGGVTFTLRIPAVAIGPDVEISVTPVTLGGAPFDSFGALRFGPSGTTFLVPATITAEGLPDVPVASALLDDEGRGTVLTFVPSADGIAQAHIEHFSVAAIIDAGSAAGAISAAGLEHVPNDPVEAAPALARAFNETVVPAIDAAHESILTFAFAARMLSEWGAAQQNRELEITPSSALGGRTFGEAAADAADELVVAGERLLADLSEPKCRDGSGLLRHPFDWLGAVGHMAKALNVIGGDDFTPTQFEPCLTLAVAPEVLTQGGPIPRTQRFVQVLVGLEATTPTGFTAPMRGSFEIEATGLGPDADRIRLLDTPSPALTPVDLDRGSICAERTESFGVTIRAALLNTLDVDNLILNPVTATLAYTGEPADVCPVETSVIVTPANLIMAPGATQQFSVTTVPEGLPVSWFATGGVIDQQGLFTAGPTTDAALIQASALDRSGSGSITIGIIPQGTYRSFDSTAFVNGRTFVQRRIWNWEVTFAPAGPGFEVTLSRAERTDEPAAPPFTVTVPVTAQDAGNGVELRGSSNTFDLFNVKFFDTGEVRVDLRGTNLPPALCDLCTNAEGAFVPRLVETGGWGPILLSL